MSEIFKLLQFYLNVSIKYFVAYAQCAITHNTKPRSTKYLHHLWWQTKLEKSFIIITIPRKPSL
jgi:hypothetical protein